MERQGEKVTEEREVEGEEEKEGEGAREQERLSLGEGGSAPDIHGPFEQARVGWRVLGLGQNRGVGPSKREDQLNPETFILGLVGCFGDVFGSVLPLFAPFCLLDAVGSEICRVCLSIFREP